MDLQQPEQTQPLAPQPTPPVQTQAPPSIHKKTPFYRSYWIFAAIYLIIPPVIGLVILLTGPIYKKQKDGQEKPISKLEKTALTIIALLLWTYAVFLR